MGPRVVTIEIDDRDYTRRHGRPKGTGRWVFAFTGGDDDGDGPMVACGCYREALRMARTWAAEHGHTRITLIA
jgi:hypothetical protein